MATADFSDAYMHLNVHSDELHSCLALRSLAPVDQFRSQVYMDDPLFLIKGTLIVIDSQWLLSLLLLTITALGFNVAWHQGSRGSIVTWIGVSFRPRWRDHVVDIALPAKFVRELLEEVRALLDTSMCGLRRLHTLAPRLSSAAGVLKSSALACSRDGTEELRRLRRRDQRDKRNLVATKRVRLPLTWWVALLQEERTIITIPLHSTVSMFMIAFDASPWGLGAVLAHWSGQPLQYFASCVREDDAHPLAIDLGSSASQA
eukprot:784760-Amphidinium_carterae.1